jgi:hypothetical protein
MSKIEIDSSDLEKIRDALLDCAGFFQHRDDMNAFVHCSKPRLSPLTSKVIAAEERCAVLLASTEEVAAP